MRNTIKYIFLTASVLIAGASGAKTLTGISPVSAPSGLAKEELAYDRSLVGQALLELDSRVPGKKLNSLIQDDGIVNFRPDLLFGLQDDKENAVKIRNMQMSNIPYGASNLGGFMGYNNLGLNVGMYNLPLSSSEKFNLLYDASDLVYSLRGAAAGDGYYVMSFYGTTVQNGINDCETAIFDLNNWKMIAQMGDYGDYARLATDMTYDPTTERFYGCFLNSDQTKYVLGYMKLDKTIPSNTIYSVTEICDLEDGLNGIAADKNGVLWGINYNNGALVTINKKTGRFTTVANTGFIPKYNGSLTWDNTNDILYWSVTYDDNKATDGIASAILTIDPTSGTLSRAYDFNEGAQVCGLFTESTPQSLAPGEFTNFNVSIAEEGDLNGTMTYDAPTGYYNGQAATGELAYTLTIVKDNGYIAYNEDKTTTYGATGISVPFEVKTAGNYTFTLQAKNEAGAGYPVSVTKYLGVDLPNPALNVNVAYENGIVTVTWDPVDSTIHEGYYNPDERRYEITLTQIDEFGVSRSFKAQTVTEEKAEWTVENSDNLYGYQAGVTTFFGEKQGETVETPVTWFGALHAPFTQTMRQAVDGWSVYTTSVNGWEKYGGYWAIPYVWGQYNSSLLFSPAIYMEEGKYYTFSFSAFTDVVKHTVEVWIGKEPVIDAMNTRLVDTTITGSSAKNSDNVTFGYACPETGTYNICFFNDTRSDTWTNKPYMYLFDVTCAEASDEAPAAPEMVVDYSKKGELKADVTIVAPTTDFAGTAIEKVEKLTLSVDGTVVATWDDVEAGKELTYAFEASKSNTYSFLAQAFNDGLDGIPCIVNVYLGMSTPVDPEWVKVAATETPGTVDITWSPVTKGTNGQEIDPEVMAYNVINVVENRYVQKGVTESQYTYKACEPEDQATLYISVNAETKAGSSSTYGTYSAQGLMQVGTPYSLPVIEDFHGGYVTHSWTMVNQHSAYDQVAVINTKQELGYPDANGDGYCLLAFVPYHASSAGLYSGKISIPSTVTNPTFGIAVLRVNYDNVSDNDNDVMISVIGDRTSATLAPIRYGDQAYGWKYFYYDFSMFKGQTINLLFTFETNSYTSHYIDDIQLFDAKTKDIAVSTISVPEKATTNKDVNIGVTVTNLGKSLILSNAAKVELYRENDNVLVDSKPLNVLALPSFASTQIVFTDNLNTSHDTEITYRAEVVYDGDENSDNNTATATMNLTLPTLPAPISLYGERDEEGFASLAWEEPDLSPSYQIYEIDFEHSVDVSTTDLGGFKSIDMDGNYLDADTHGVSGIAGFFTFQHSGLARSGEWMLVSACNENGAAKDDWLISPELSGHEQTISFYARTNWNMYEEFSVLTSTTGDNPADFTETVLQTKTTSNDWTLYNVKVPAGTKYFAIHCQADDTTDLVYLMLDDFKFDGKDMNEGLVLEGYNTYRNNAKIIEGDTEKAYTDKETSPGAYYYRVTARYGDRGESASSNEVYLFTRGGVTDSIDSVTDNVGKVYTTPGHIFIEGAQGASVTVTDLKGCNVFSKDSAGERESISVTPGIYVVSIDGSPIKLKVK